MDVPSSLVDRYLQRRIKDLNDGQTALKALDYSTLERIGHQLKGNGSTFGFPDLSVLGSKLEMAAIEKNHEQMEMLLSNISTWIKNKISSNSSL